MEKRAFYTKGEKVPMKWHIAPSNSTLSYLHRKRCIFQIFLLVVREYHMVRVVIQNFLKTIVVQFVFEVIG